jgi:hypothetical protein
MVIILVMILVKQSEIIKIMLIIILSNAFQSAITTCVNQIKILSKYST